MADWRLPLRRAGLCGLLALVATATGTESPTWELANTLSVQYNSWVAARNLVAGDAARVGTVSVSEFMQWQKVKAAWRQMEHRVDAEYRGEKNR